MFEDEGVQDRILSKWHLAPQRAMPHKDHSRSTH